MADGCNRVLVRELSEEEGAAHAELVRKAENKELGAWESFGVSKPLKAVDFGKSAVDARWVLTRRGRQNSEGPSGSGPERWHCGYLEMRGPSLVSSAGYPP